MDIPVAGIIINVPISHKSDARGQLCFQSGNTSGILCYLFGGEDGFVKINHNPKAILIDISVIAHVGMIEKTNT